MKIAIATLWDQPCRDYGQISNKSKQMYCDKHSYTFIFCNKLYYTSKFPGWSKLPFLLQHLSSYDYIVWMDADACITNPDFDLQTVLTGKDFYISEDCNGINTGVFAVKNSQIGKEILMKIDSLYQEFKTAIFHQQSATSYVVHELYKDKCQIVPATVWNSYLNVYNSLPINIWKPGDFIVHMPDARALNHFGEHFRRDTFIDLTGITL